MLPARFLEILADLACLVPPCWIDIPHYVTTTPKAPSSQLPKLQAAAGHPIINTVSIDSIWDRN